MALPALDAALDAVRILSPSSRSPLRGEDHWLRVAANGLFLAEAVDADPVLVVLFAMFHDSMRFNDDSDEGHGQRGGFLACCLNDQLLGLSDDRLDVLVRACSDHAGGRTSSEPTIGVCWDADRLDLCRLGSKPDPAKLSTEKARLPMVQDRARSLLGVPPDWPHIFGRLPVTPQPESRRAVPELARVAGPVAAASSLGGAVESVVAAESPGPAAELEPAAEPVAAESPREREPAQIEKPIRFAAANVPEAAPMPVSPDEPIERRVYDTAGLMKEHPPVLIHALKRELFSIASPPGAVHSGKLTFSRWYEMPLPESIDLGATPDRLMIREGFYDYRPLFKEGLAAEWHVNFADPELFGSYGIHYMAQDELQVAEHPALGALREALLAEGFAAVTVEGSRPTPVLVMGAERRIRIAIEPNAEEGRPDGLYGGAFRKADPDAVRRATSVIDPPTVTNVIAISALSNGHGRYTREQLDFNLMTAYSGFRAAVLESGKRPGKPRQVVVHTGFWGAGASGGNPVLLSLLQLVAAEMAGVDMLVFYPGAPSRLSSLERALSVLRDQVGTEPASPAQLLERLDEMAFTWGSGDGN
jgi:hypothetical protein